MKVYNNESELKVVFFWNVEYRKTNSCIINTFVVLSQRYQLSLYFFVGC